MIALREVEELLRYDRETGNLIWKVQRGSRASPGSIAGRASPNGGVKMMSLLGQSVPVRNIVWLLNRGVLPSGIIVHNDYDPENTRIENLRDLPEYESRLHAYHKDSPPGIYQTTSGKFVAIINGRNRPFFLGVFNSIEEANKIKMEYDIPEIKKKLITGSKTKEFYVYAHFYPETKIPFYVGKGKGRRAYDLNCRNPRHREIVRELSIRGKKPIILLTRERFTEKEALRIERALILKIGFSHLVNHSIGGEGLEKYSFSKKEIELVDSFIRKW